MSVAQTTLDQVEIKNDKLREVQEQLRKFVPDWPGRIAQLISKDKTWKKWSNNDCTDTNVRNVLNGIIKSQLHRRLVMTYANELLEESIKSLKSVHDKFDQITQTTNEIIETETEYTGTT